jgi:hypothetical protein
MQLKYLIIIFSVFGVIVLYGLSLLVQPILISLEELPDYEGKNVIVQGTVLHHSSTQFGSQFITICPVNITTNITQAIVFTEHPLTIHSGDIIQATGKVQQYKDDWEIMTSSEQDITILHHWENITTPLWELAEHPLWFTTININVTGMIDRLYDSYFYLIDETGSYNLFINYNTYEFPAVYEGQTVYVTGIFTYDQAQLRYQLEAENIRPVSETEASP